jgi:HEAT repeat protein
MQTIQTLVTELTSGDDTRAEAAVHALKAHGQAAVAALSAITTSDNADIRWWALRSLAEFPDVDIGDYLIAGLEDTDIAVQQCAALGLRHHPDAYAIPELVALLDHEDRLLTRLCADALIALGEKATQSLISVLEHGSQAARLEAVRALASIGDRNAISALFKVSEEDSQILQYWAGVGLDKMGIGMSFFKP